MALPVTSLRTPSTSTASPSVLSIQPVCAPPTMSLSKSALSVPIPPFPRRLSFCGSSTPHRRKKNSATLPRDARANKLLPSSTRRISIPPPHHHPPPVSHYPSPSPPCPSVH